MMLRISVFLIPTDNTMKSFRLFVLPALVASVLFLGCDADPMHSNDEVDASLMVQGMFGSTPLSTGTVYDHNGAKVDVSAARIYLSDIVLTTADGQEVTFTSDPVAVPAKDEDGNDITHTLTNKVVLAKNDLGMQESHLGTAPAGDYSSVSFRIGIVGQDNRVDASQLPATHPMAKQTDKNNHWSWAAGYIYLRLDGQVDTDGDDVVDSNWEAHIGGNANSRVVTLDTPFTLSETANQIHIMVDYQHFLQNVDMSTESERITHGMDNPPMAMKVVGMLDSGFMLHGIHESDHAH